MTSPLLARFPGASFALDFRKGIGMVNGVAVLDPLAQLTCARTGASYYWGRDGNVHIGTDNVPRISYRPMTGERRGILVEGFIQRASFYPQDMSVGTWVLSNMQSPIGAQAYGIDGARNAWLVAETSATGFHAIGTGVTASADAPYAAVAVVQSAGRSKFGLVLTDNTSTNLANVIFDTADNSAVASSGNGGIEAIGQGRYLIWASGLSSTAGVSSVAVNLFTVNDSNLSNFAGDTTKGILVGYLGIHFGVNGPSVPILFLPSGASSHGWDAISISTAGQPWFNASEGTVYAEFEPDGSTGQNTHSTAGAIDALFMAASGGDGISLGRDTTSGNAFTFIAQGTNLVTLLTGKAGSPGMTRAALAYKANDFAFVTDGGDIATTTIPGVPSALGTIYLGSTLGTANHLQGTIGCFAYWPTRRSNDHLQMLVD